MSNVVPLTPKRKPKREPWRDHWEAAFTVRQLMDKLAFAPHHARVYLRHVRLGIVGVTEIDTQTYTGANGGCYGQPTVLLYINHAELTPERE
jgi:hypothetical protein